MKGGEGLSPEELYRYGDQHRKEGEEQHPNHEFEDAPKGEELQLGRDWTLSEVGKELRSGVVMGGFGFGEGDDFVNDLSVMAVVGDGKKDEAENEGECPCQSQACPKIGYCTNNNRR